MARRKLFDALRFLRRSNGRHDRWYTIAFMRESIRVLAQPGDVNEKVIEVAALARRLAPAIGVARASERRGPRPPGSNGEGYDPPKATDGMTRRCSWECQCGTWNWPAKP
jgi:hypothetical protein